jgi:hypothetical protein
VPGGGVGAIQPVPLAAGFNYLNEECDSGVSTGRGELSVRYPHDKRDCRFDWSNVYVVASLVQRHGSLSSAIALD